MSNISNVAELKRKNLMTACRIQMNMSCHRLKQPVAHRPESMALRHEKGFSSAEGNLLWSVKYCPNQALAYLVTSKRLTGYFPCFLHARVCHHFGLLYRYRTLIEEDSLSREGPILAFIKSTHRKHSLEPSSLSII